ncbi:type II toxin-antitoxin system VapC family toxin [Modestobacter altitudinis]|uniref:type II toxin-antitoxin system VapC family toxin n=1 Tax=Modestobacter altitudinis TaxID=2213158 RepID=UPI00110CE780|nr:type II toxin-antitoxin system VapC family toxin [Modestobacter altitudinis]
MIAYFDTSAVIPLLVADEPGGPVCRRIWDSAATLVTTRLTYVEAAAALARAARLGRLGPPEHDASLAGLDELWRQFDLLDIDDQLVDSAARLARRHALRGFDAVHCAAAARLADPTTVAMSGDHALVTAWSAEGLATIDTSSTP